MKRSNTIAKLGGLIEVHAHLRALEHTADPNSKARKDKHVQPGKESSSKLNHTLKRNTPMLFGEHAHKQEKWEKPKLLNDLKTYTKKRKVGGSTLKQVETRPDKKGTQ